MKTFFLLLASFSCCYSFAQTASWQEKIKEKMMTDEKIRHEEDQKDLNDEDQNILIEDQNISNDDQNISNDDRNISTEESDTGLVQPEAWDTNFDNLLNSWYVEHYTNKLDHTGYDDNVYASDSVYMDRLSRLPNVIELPYNETVRRCIDLYVERRRSLVEYMLGLEAFYFPMVEELLDKYGLPLELKYLIIVESAMNPVALSRAGASGLWQFMLSTGKIYGLEINSLLDERCDPIKSTDAACRYLKDLYNTYGDWNLAIAAYNCGGGNVNKAIRRSGGKKDYWAIYPYLPKETRSYVPFFIAANYVMNYYSYHQLYPVQTTLPLSTDTVMVNRMIHFDQIAEVLRIDKDVLRALNPQYKRDIIPGNYKPQILKLPSMQAYAYVEKENEIANYRVDELLTNRMYVEEPAAINRMEKITHRVTYGESVITIAHKYGVTIKNVLKWNNLRSNKVTVGKYLVLYVDNGGYMARNPVKSYNQPNQPRPTSSSVAEKSSSSGTSTSDYYPSVNTVRYKVQQGDSFYTIAQKFPGYSHTDLMRLNNLTRTALKVGQYILVPKI